MKGMEISTHHCVCTLPLYCGTEVQERKIALCSYVGGSGLDGTWACSVANTEMHAQTGVC